MSDEDTCNPLRACATHGRCWVHSEWESPLFAPSPVGAPKTFDEAWARMKARGYDYGEDALENVRLGWDLAQPLFVEALAHTGVLMVEAQNQMNKLCEERDEARAELAHVAATANARPGVSAAGAVAALVKDRDGCARERDEARAQLAEERRERELADVENERLNALLGVDPTVTRTVGAALRAARTVVGLTMGEVAHRTTAFGGRVSEISAIETGRRLPTLEELDVLLSFYKIDGEQRARLVLLCTPDM